MLGLSQKEKNVVLMAALKSESREAIAKALQKGGDPNMIVPDTQKPLLIWVTDTFYDSQAERIAELLIGAGADVRLTDGKNNTALHAALNRRNDRVIRMLMAAGADTTVKNTNGETPFSMSVRSQYWHIAATLVDGGALKQMTAAEGELPPPFTVLMNALDSNAPTSLLTKILEQVPDINIGLDKSRSPLHTVASQDLKDALRVLLERPEVNINVENRMGRQPLHAALGSKHFDIARTLIDKGADLAHADKNGITPLVLAARGGNTGLVNLILRRLTEAKIKPDVQGAFFAAAAEGHARTLDVLIAAGADKDSVNDKGETALTLASFGNHMEALKMLTVKHEVDTQIADLGGLIAYDHAKAKAHKEAMEYLIQFQPGYTPPEPPPPPPPPIDTSRFVKTSDTTIDVKEKGLTMTFNFWMQQVILRDPERPTVPMVVQNFDDVQRKECIAEARDMLIRLNGKPPEIESVYAQKKPLSAPAQKP